jgi:hypothetical protein
MSLKFNRIVMKDIIIKGVGVKMAQTFMKEITFGAYGCTDGKTLSVCKECKLTQWECVVFKENTQFIQLYAIKGEF